MEVSVAAQTVAFLESMLLGAAAGAIYGIFSAVRLLNPNGRLWVLFWDLLYFFLMAVVSFLFFFAAEEGMIRGYLYAGELFGWSLWRLTLGTLWEKGLFSGIRTVQKLGRYGKRKRWESEEKIRKIFFKKAEKSGKIS